ncbi:exopolysaccharide biosynthesis protein [Roseivivax halodurans JCM 10272]|uniref:Exopolysaccharide biosynthesis protein n=1 Tax=Roseivivax halodurans JCM 10272 TaxID=1449350 RepID=X7EMW9_9RHOB|nr:sugar transferase [Roseivivax halodurans]ETX16493.1 exopolysaccharide biosynthesis protein [Roseivivax halodurans JCM 10272]
MHLDTLEQQRLERSAAPLGGVAKRSFDIGFAILAILAFSGVMLVVAVITKLCSPGPIFFVHERVGHGGRTFACLKFRTMVVDADERLKEHLRDNIAARREFEADSKLKNDPRIIPVVGKLLRSTSLDEVPQFFNVLVGHMSIVGPRPITRAELERYDTAKSDYLATRPGITGLWQVSGRSNISFDRRVKIDATYVRHWSFRQDLEIVCKTPRAVMWRDGAC